MNKKAGTLIFLLSVTANLCADVKLPALLSDNMVLQQQSDARCWGWAAPGEKVVVHGSWAIEDTKTVTTDKEGKWKTEIKTPKAGGPYTITVKGTNTIELKNILIGEVWVCSGQSYMEFRLPNATDLHRVGIPIRAPTDRPVFKALHEVTEITTGVAVG